MTTSRSHVCILTTVHRALDTRIFHKQARTLARAGYRVTYLAPHSRDEVLDGITIHALPRRRLLPRLFALPGVFRRALAVGANVYHLHDPELILVGWWLHLAGRRVIYDAHEDMASFLPGKVYLPGPLGAAIAPLADWLEKRIACRLDAVIGATEDIVSRFRGGNTYLVKNYPIVGDSLSPPRSPEAGWPGLHAIYVGDLVRERGILEMVQAVAQLDPAHEVRLTIVGSFPHPDYEAEVRAAAGERVTFTGWLPHSQAMGLLHQSDVGLACLHPAPNHLRAWPVKLLEYMCAGLPAIVSDIPLWLEIAVDTGCGIGVDPLDPDSIAAALCKLADDPQRRRAMGERGWRLVREKYNWESQERVLLELYAGLVGTHSCTDT